jgi:ribosomal protein L11 methyltransferase
MKKSWCWRRWIARSDENLWIEKLQRLDCQSWAVLQSPERTRTLLTAYFPTRAGAMSLSKKLGGQVAPLSPKQWLRSGPSPKLEISPGFQILHDKLPAKKKPAMAQLYLPHGLAFGSGEHSTTFMLLRALARRTSLDQETILDLGTGSGVLALTARLFGATRITATDIDAEAIRTARQNEALNFRSNLIRWEKADAKLLDEKSRYSLVVANLFSGILCAAAQPIAACLADGGELWLSGILRTQQEEVTAAYRRLGLHLSHAQCRGKWVMLQIKSSPARRKTASRQSNRLRPPPK